MGSPGSTGIERGQPGYKASTIIDSSKTSSYQRDLIDKGVDKIIKKTGNSDAAGAYYAREMAKTIAINTRKGLIPGNPVSSNGAAKVHPDNKNNAGKRN
jgi:hypothetical protein